MQAHVGIEQVSIVSRANSFLRVTLAAHHRCFIGPTSLPIVGQNLDAVALQSQLSLPT